MAVNCWRFLSSVRISSVVDGDLCARLVDEPFKTARHVVRSLWRAIVGSAILAKADQQRVNDHLIYCKESVSYQVGNYHD